MSTLCASKICQRLYINTSEEIVNCHIMSAGARLNFESAGRFAAVNAKKSPAT